MKRGIDLEFGKKQITASVTSGILMGSSTSRIAADLRERIVGMSVDSALRAARTAVTAAENGGRQSSYERAAEMGIEMTREWLATRDARTRHAHGMADGQRVAVDEPFIVGGEELMFPGDTSHGASGWNVYNCRCTLLSWIKGHERKRETYPEWLEKKFEEDPEGTALEFKKVARASADKKQWQEYRAIVGNAVPNSLDKFQDLKYTNPKEWNYTKGLKRYKAEVPEATKKDYDNYLAVKATGVQGTVRVPPASVDVNALEFKDEHGAHHGCSLDDAKHFVSTAKCSIRRKLWDGYHTNYYSIDGATYVQDEVKKINTAFPREKYDADTNRLMGVFE